jgi:tetratricopeptide (TPR) repeat protein
MATTQQQSLSKEIKPQAAPPSAPATPALHQRLTEQIRLVDKALAAAVVAFAFLAASFPARNSDFFLHVASGRLLAQGQYVFGEDPFCFTTAGVYWANPAWLSDLLFYSLYSIPEVGETVVVLFKALLAAVLAFVMLQTARRRGGSWWIPSACVALAILVLSPRLLLQSVCISYMFLALTLWLLLSPDPDPHPHPVPDSDERKSGSGSGWGMRRCWLLPLLFLLWVNLDDWFLLGPATVALYLLGEALHLLPLSPPADAQTPSPRRLRTLALVLVAGLAACLLNPHHVRAFALPWELGLTRAADALAQDNDFRYLFGSPFQDLLLQRTTGLNLAALAYVPLLVLGIVSFAQTWGSWRFWRVLLWLAFLALSLATSRAVPFFAIVAGPIVSLNLLDFAARRFPAPLPVLRLRWTLGGRLLTLALGLALSIAVFPGWLHSASARRSVGWSVRIDPSLRHAALQIRDWREQGLIPADARMFNTLPQAACYLAWFCPGERNFIDPRLALFPEAAGDFVRVRNALAAEGAGTPDGPWALPDALAWRSVFRKWKIHYLMFHAHDPRLPTSQIVEQRLMVNPDGWRDEWTLCYLDGRTIIVGWKDAERDQGKEPYAALRWNADRLAFGPSPLPLSPLGRGAESEGSLAADEAFVHSLHYQSEAPRLLNRHRQGWEAAMAAMLVGGAAAPGGPLANGTLLLSRLDFTYRVLHGQLIAPPGTPPQPPDLLAEQLLSRHLGEQDSGSPASLFLTVRAARRALTENANDAGTLLLLGEAYLRLAWKTRERGCARSLPHAALIRQSQAAAALERAARLNPNLERAHELLAELYENAVHLPIPQRRKLGSEQLIHHPNLEATLRHHREQLRCSRGNGPLAGEKPEAFARRLDRIDKAIGQFAQRLDARLDQWELAAAKKPLFVRVQLALEAGLCETALKLLLEAGADEALTGPQRGAVEHWSIELLLSMGRLDEARALLDRDNRQALGMLPMPLALPAHDWFRVQLAAAGGDYEEVEQRLAALLDAPKAKGVTPSVLLAWTIGDQLLWDAPLAAAMPWQIVRKWPELIGRPPRGVVALLPGLNQSFRMLQQETDVQALRGWLALETGDTGTARRCLAGVLESCLQTHRGGALNLRARPLALLYEEWLRANE